MELKKDDDIILDLDSYSCEVKISEIYFVHSPVTLWQEFQKLLTIVKMDEPKDGLLLNRR